MSEQLLSHLKENMSNPKHGRHNWYQEAWNVIADLRSQLATLTAERDKLREKVESLADAWCGKAVESHEEANRIRRTMRMITDAEERCTVRGDVLNRCAEELNWILSTPDAKGA